MIKKYVKDGKLSKGAKSVGKAARGALRVVGEATGASAIAREVLDVHDSTVAALVAKAREKGVSEKKIAAALRGYSKLQRIQNLAAILFPFLPAPAALEALAGNRKKPKQ